ncbi:hypothetical protein, partial [Peterkaempfera griseoplana]|uniref:hypothetical protein n=1 Tax=Peterkaempfera griseoplana TaxID=66896 RepID=UPI000AA32CE7
PAPTIVRLERPDLDAVRDQVQAETRAQLDAVTDSVERAHRVGQLVAQADTHLARLRPERDSLALALWAYERTRGLEQSMGVSRPSWVKIHRPAPTGRPRPRPPGSPA